MTITIEGDFDSVFKYLEDKEYPSYTNTKDTMRNFRCACSFYILFLKFKTITEDAKKIS